MKHSQEKCPSEQELLKLVENELDEHERSIIDGHVLTCERCRMLVEEYRDALRLLAGDRIPELNPTEWQSVMVTVRAKLRTRMKGRGDRRATGRMDRRPRLFPGWALGTAAAAASVTLFLILWNAGIIDLGGPSSATRGASTPAEETVAGGKVTEVGEDVPLVAANDLTKSLDLASLTNDELHELEVLSTSRAVIGDYDLLAASFNEEKQAELLKTLEGSLSEESM